MSHPYTAHWHKTSYDRFLIERLPGLLAGRVPLAGYDVETVDTYRCRVTIALTAADGPVRGVYDLPQPDEEGVFMLDEESPRVVVPTAPSAALETADVSCVGELLYDYLDGRLGKAPGDMGWDESQMRVWLPLDGLADEFFRTSPQSQRTDQPQWPYTGGLLSRVEHTRRIYLEESDPYFNPEQFGRVCPVLMPESFDPNINHVRHIAIGAEIRDGRVVTVDEDPARRYSVSVSSIPLTQHGDRNRNQMGANRMRQWYVPSDPEPALVQTGLEPDAPDFWCGRNLLTAFILWDGYTHEEGIVLSESGAARLNFPDPTQVGDKISNRHGIWGCVARIVPDGEMPCMADGTPVELIYSGMGGFTRITMGQIRETVMSRIARAEGAPVVVPPLQAPSEVEVKERLRKNGLPEDGMEALTVDGKPLAQRSTVGWVYWGRASQDAKHKFRAVSHLSPEDIEAGLEASAWKVGLPAYSTTESADEVSGWPTRGNRQGNMEQWALRDLGAFENLFEYYNLKNSGEGYRCPLPDQENLADRLVAGSVEQADPPGPNFLDLQYRLGCAGIVMELKDEALHFRFGPPSDNSLKLARPVPHPWLHERPLAEIGLYGDMPEAGEVVTANDRLSDMLDSGIPEALIGQAAQQLQEKVAGYFKALLHRSNNVLGNSHMNFTGRGTIVPDPKLHYDQIGIPDEMAWALFGPQTARELDDLEAVKQRTDQAAKKLDEIMTASWVITNHAPTLELTNHLAFHPVRRPGYAVHVHPFLAQLMNANHDGDMVAVFLPLTDAAQKEAEDRISIAAHVARDPSIIRTLLEKDAVLGLAYLSLTEQGRKEIGDLAGADVDMSVGYLTAASLNDALSAVLERDGAVAALDTTERLMRRGFEAACATGASLNPFFGAGIDRAHRPDSDDPEVWGLYAEELIEQAMARTDFEDPDIGIALLSIKSGARGRAQHLRWWIGALGNVTAPDGTRVPARESLSEGKVAATLHAEVFGAHRGMTRIPEETTDFGKDFRAARFPKGFNVMARAIRTTESGIVFARAAAIEEVDPLLDVDSRMLVGLPPKE